MNGCDLYTASIQRLVVLSIGLFFPFIYLLVPWLSLLPSFSLAAPLFSVSALAAGFFLILLNSSVAAPRTPRHAVINPIWNTFRSASFYSARTIPRSFAGTESSRDVALFRPTPQQILLVNQSTC